MSPKALLGTLDMRDLLYHLNLPWGFALQAHTNISSVERHETHCAHSTTTVATQIDRPLHLS
jgi:hypothetical protein